MKLKGLYTAMITPFDEKGKLDIEGFEKNIDFQLDNKIDGLLVAGSTGESPTLSLSEKETLIKIARRKITDSTQLMVGTGNYSTTQTIQNTKQAQDLGADVALIVTPYYNKPTQEGVYRHFEAICTQVSLPICIYDNPGRTITPITIATFKRLIELPTIIGLKETSGSLMHMFQALAEVLKAKPDFGVLTGDDANAYSLITSGGHGAISVISNVLPTPYRSLIQHALNGDFKEALKWHYDLLPFFQILSIETNPIPIKAAMKCLQMPAGECRLPLCNLSQEHQLRMSEFIKSIPSHWLKKHG